MSLHPIPLLLLLQNPKRQYTREKAEGGEHGRWWVTWIKLEGDMSEPEALTRELLVFETDEAGRLRVREV